MSENEKMNIDHQVAVLALVNLAAEAVKKVILWIEPVLGPVLTTGQIVIAVLTIVWLWQRVKGVKLDNKMKQKELDKE
jgi:hypothetical protein